MLVKAIKALRGQPVGMFEHHLADLLPAGTQRMLQPLQVEAHRLIGERQRHAVGPQQHLPEILVVTVEQLQHVLEACLKHLRRQVAQAACALQHPIGLGFTAAQQAAQVPMYGYQPLWAAGS